MRVLKKKLLSNFMVFSFEFWEKGWENKHSERGRKKWGDVWWGCVLSDNRILIDKDHHQDINNTPLATIKIGIDEAHWKSL